MKNVMIRVPVRLNDRKEEKVTFMNGQVFYTYMFTSQQEHDEYFNIEDWEGSDDDQSLPSGAI